MKKPIEVGDVNVHLIWFDSLGAKSSCILVETPDVSILVDPGVAIMQPSYPLSIFRKLLLVRKAFDEIVKAAKKADVVTISHYHYDHHELPSEAMSIYDGKELWIKDPNKWINESQWERSRLFLSQLYEELAESSFDEILESPAQFEIKDPMDRLPIASSKDYGDYQERKIELLKKGKAWLNRCTKRWMKEPWVSEFEVEETKVRFADGKSFKVGSTEVRFTEPMFHGLEYDRVGWVIGVAIEYGSTKVIHASDLQGPMIEDYASWIIEENPDVLVLDGPPTYLFGYMLNRINLNRGIENACSIIRNADISVTVYDHHLPRDPLFRERVSKVYEVAQEEGKIFLTAAEWMGSEPLVLKLARK